MLSLLVGMMAGFGVSAAEEPTVEIVSKNVYYADTLRLMYAVKATEGYDVAVKIYNAEDELVGNGIAGDGEFVQKTVNLDGVDCPVFVSDFGVPAQDIDTELFAVAELSKDGAVVKTSAPVKYSVLTYLHERLSVASNATADQKEMYRNLLKYANSADIVINEDADTDSISNYSYVTVTNGTVDGYDKGMYKVGTEISNLATTFTPTAGKVLAWEIVEYDEKTPKGTTVIRATDFESYVVTGYSAVITATEVDAEVVKTTGTLVTDVSALTTGVKIAIVAVEEGATMGVKDKNNIKQANVTKDGNTISFENTAGVTLLTVEKVGDVYYLSFGEEGYLYAAGGTNNNYLRVKEKADICQWTIEITDGVATIKAADSSITRNWLRYNSSSDLFSCYSSGQKDIAIYIINE